MSKRVEIKSKQVIFERFFFQIQEARLRHELYNGQMSNELIRLSWERGDSVAVIMHDQKADTIVLTEQFRYPTYEKGPGWIVEIPAGTVEDDEIDDPTRTLRREIMEEIGYRIEKLRPVSTFYLSPGGASERIHLYYASVSPKQQVAQGGGKISEGEDIRVLTARVDAALRGIETGHIVDAKTIIGLQWLQLNRSSL